MDDHFSRKHFSIQGAIPSEIGQKPSEGTMGDACHRGAEERGIITHPPEGEGLDR